MSSRVALAALALLALAGAARADDGVAARVNGTPISTAMVNQVVKGAISGRPQPPSSEEIAKLSDAALDSLIDLELLAQAAQARGITVSDAQVDAEIARQKAKFASAADYDKAMAASGLTAAELRTDTRKTLQVNQLLDTVVWKNVTISPEQVRAYYDQHKDQLGGKTFDAIRPAIERALLEDARDTAQRRYVDELRSKAKIEK
ncbi:MAG: SurA N-terminal domain-containing protein [Deltaproteobacteria bacterium]|nr:SurA N-terminal domain-containing protein [Deltaproteobacteria bacterium]